MDKRGFFIGLIFGMLRGALSPTVAAELLSCSLPNEALRASEADLFKRCEQTLRDCQGHEGVHRESELRYLLECLQGERDFEPEHPACSRPVSLLIQVRISHGVVARVQSADRYRGVTLTTLHPALMADLQKLQCGKEFLELLTWHDARRRNVAGQPYYLLPGARLPHFIRELKLFLESHFPGV